MIFLSFSRWIEVPWFVTERKES